MIDREFYITLFSLMLVIALSACRPASTEPAADTETEAGESTEIADTGETDETARLILATTTSTYDTGLLDAILPAFEADSGYSIEVIAVGTGQALALGEAGDADVVLVHARALEDAFVADGYGSARYDVMYNDFVILGSPNDPANIAGDNAVQAMRAIADAEATFVSRGDDSGTHVAELNLWQEAGISPEGDWYQEAGQGMSEVITMANEQHVYTLSDRGTYIARNAEGLQLVVLVEGDARLANPYGVIPVNPERHPDINAEGAQAFADWLISMEAQTLIAEFTVEGQQLFFPDSEAYRASQAE
ncbi:MAG: substrate-binding domain-containing protein [Anaerolineae bacterium]